jgi:hypothetical protein
MINHETDTILHSFEGTVEYHASRNQCDIMGKFHYLVPEDVIKSLKDAEYIMVHSYYHYPVCHDAPN